MGQEFRQGLTEQSTCSARPWLGSFCGVSWDWTDLEGPQWFTLIHGALVGCLSTWDPDSMIEPIQIQGEGGRLHRSKNLWPFLLCYTLQIPNPTGTALLAGIKWRDALKLMHYQEVTLTGSCGHINSGLILWRESSRDTTSLWSLSELPDSS